MAPDFLVIGGGIVGISIARELKSRFSDAAVTLIEKEPACGLHASGRNSGVLHAGFYYSADSLKAKFTRVGNEAMTAYCASRNIPLNRCGKLVVAKDEGELSQLDELLSRGARNKVPLENLTEEQAREIEPRDRVAKRSSRGVELATSKTMPSRRRVEPIARVGLRDFADFEARDRIANLSWPERSRLSRAAETLVRVPGTTPIKRVARNRQSDSIKDRATPTCARMHRLRANAPTNARPIGIEE